MGLFLNERNKLSMKRILLLMCLLTGLNAGAQLGQYPNFDFENWEAVDSLVSLEGWNTTYFADPNSASRITDAQDQQYALRLETSVNDDEDTITGFMAYGDFTSGEFLPIEYTSNVDSLVLWMRWDMQPNDTGAVAVVQVVNGNPQPIFNAVQVFGSQATWVRVAINMISPGQDSIQIAVSTENFFGDSDPIVGSYIEIDNISFVGSPTPDALPNPSFEDWDVVNIEEPLEFGTTNSILQNFGFPANVIQSTDAQSGMYAVEMSPDIDAEIPGGVFTAEIGIDGELTNGVPYTGKPDSLVGWFKSTIVDEDSSVMSIEFFDNGTPIFESIYFFGAATDWTRISIPLDVQTAPDTLRILWLSGEEPGSFLALDNFKFVGGDLGLNEKPSIEFALYPNPTSEFLNINSNSVLDKVDIYDINGRLMKSVKMNGTMKFINVGSLAAGQYIVKASTKNETVSQSLIIK